MLKQDKAYLHNPSAFFILIKYLQNISYALWSYVCKDWSEMLNANSNM